MSTKELSTAIRSILEENGIISHNTVTHMNLLSGESPSEDIIGNRVLFIMDIIGGKKLFVKYCSDDPELNQKTCISMLEAEMAGLKALRSTNTVKVPEPIAVGKFGKGAFFVAEYIDLKPLKTQRKLGEQLAALHLAKGPGLFGFDHDNWIGTTPQPNKWHKSWVEFLHMRLKHQFDLANFSESIKSHALELLHRLPEFFDGLDIRPSLVHGDLWCGNSGTDENGNPVIFDPAAYWGHHESELGIMYLFGGYSDDFFDAYHQQIPREPGHEKRIMIYKLYHLVNHYIMFGSAYLGQSKQLLLDILS
ncbi:Ketosamine-3-kinase [Coemansia reversa NRRL 1564]|uniref:protein-ribulosamine 3-kinase n=1 Tax=Coemansia reversa (strain ATCC 12441 / NRRL 1564) TaxID=763665 RepID=A0A2G5B8T3_COERN|nr:Ketosamine-3-kinase [Coemansia reversa NRRL 1564]|eukprot:PIA15428.1 Ketosamine-3-kinase [Coemansia reversa NRRL 1564]